VDPNPSSRPLSEPTLTLLDEARARSLSPLLGIGCRSGDTIVGLSSVRRAAKLAFVFASGGLAPRTLRELAGLAGGGTRVYQVAEIAVLTRSFGREDAQVVGVVPGDLARGVNQRLEGATP